MVREFKKRRDFMADKINAIKGISTIMPQGAFYCWVNISGILQKSANGKKITSSMDLTDALLTDVHVAVVPGGVFGDDHYLRLSYATSMDNIKEGLNRIERFINKLE